MKNLANGLIIVAAIAAVVWVICRFTGSLIPVVGASVKGAFQFVVVVLLFAIAISLQEK